VPRFDSFVYQPGNYSTISQPSEPDTKYIAAFSLLESKLNASPELYRKTEIIPTRIIAFYLYYEIIVLV
jgi:hypothetical protein